MGHNKSFSVNTFSAHDDDFEFDEAYFRTFYKPLSNLPTPPLSSQSSSATQSPRMLADDAEPLNSDLLAPAIHLTRMLPPGLSLEDPSVATVHTMLTHANLPMDSIALATCVLDALPGRYRNAWRMSYPRSRQTSAATKRHTLPSGPIQPPAQSDAVLPEVNILAALIIATKFVEDLHEPTAFFASEWGRDLWSCEQINVTERCIMEALGYRILPLWEEQYIKMARHDIELVRRELLDEGSELAAANREYEFSSTVAGPDAASPARPMSSGRATLGLGLQLTPTETPKTERATTPPLSQTDVLARETREAFSKSPPVPRDYLHLPLDATPRP